MTLYELYLAQSHSLEENRVDHRDYSDHSDYADYYDHGDDGFEDDFDHSIDTHNDYNED